MIQMETILDVADNSGAKKVKCIHVLGGSRKKFAKIGDIIELPCGFASLSINAQISWWKNGVQLNDIQNKIYHNSLIFELSSLSSTNDLDYYVCQIQDELIGRITSRILLKVNGKLIHFYNHIHIKIF